MTATRFWNRTAIAFGLTGLLLSATAMAGTDDFSVSSIVNVSVDGGPASTSNSFSTQNPGSTTFDTTIYPSQAVSLTATWSIKDNSAASGPDTNYNLPTGRTVSFASSTTATPGPVVVVAAISNCTVTSAASTCSTVISFPAPATEGGYQVQIHPSSTPVGAGGMNERNFFVNFSVTEPEPEALETKLTVNNQCAILNAGNVDLSALLEELAGPTPIAGKSVDFYVDPELDNLGFPTATSASVGSALTGIDGVATLTYDVNGLGAGDHNLYGEFDGDSQYLPSNDSDTLGISYLFVGFQPPINPEGNSVFGNGRVIPIKIKLVDANLVPVADATPTVWMTQYSLDTGLGEVLEPATSVSAADTGNTMRYVSEDQQYIYNWDLSSLENGTYAVVVDLGDSDACSQGPYYAVITVAKKGGKK